MTTYTAAYLALFVWFLIVAIVVVFFRDVDN